MHASILFNSRKDYLGLDKENTSKDYRKVRNMLHQTLFKSYFTESKEAIHHDVATVLVNLSSSPYYWILRQPLLPLWIKWIQSSNSKTGVICKVMLLLSCGRRFN